MPNGDITTQSRTPIYQFWFYQATSNTLKMGTKPFPEMVENLHNLMRLSAREHFIECMTYGKVQHEGFTERLL
jgi:hypothetical protein